MDIRKVQSFKLESITKVNHEMTFYSLVGLL